MLDGLWGSVTRLYFLSLEEMGKDVPAGRNDWVKMVPTHVFSCSLESLQAVLLYKGREFNSRYLSVWLGTKMRKRAEEIVEPFFLKKET